MKKVPDISPARRGRFVKKQLVTPEASQSSTEGASESSSTGKKLPGLSHASKDIPIRHQKKRNGSRSVDSISIKRRHQGSSDTTESVDGSRSTSSIGLSLQPPRSRTSSREKLDTPKLPRGRKPKTLLGLKLASSAPSISGRAKIQGVVRPHKNKQDRSKTGKSPKDQLMEAKDVQLMEIKRLSTTDGFWSTKASSRSNSPLGQPVETLMQKQAAAAKKGSRTSTPDTASSGYRRKSSNVQADKDDTTTPKLNIPVKKQRKIRVRDTPDLTSPASRTGSRDVSPASSSSLDRGARQAARTLARGNNDNKKGVISESGNKGRVRTKARLDMDGPSHNVLENLTETSQAVPLDVSSTDNTAVDSPVSRFKKKNRLAVQKTKTKQGQLPASHKNRQSLQKGSNKSKYFNDIPVAPHLTGEAAHNDAISCTSTDTEPILTSAKNRSNKTKSRPVKRVLGKVIRRPPLKIKKTGTKQIQNLLSNTDSCALENPSGELSSDVVAANEGISETISVSDLKPSSPEFNISDLVGSAELKRLNTTTGFWASMPDMGSVLGNKPQRRLRDVDSSISKRAINNKGQKQVRRATVKPQNPLLQHRKKRLHSLQYSHRKVKQHISNDHSAAQNLPESEEIAVPLSQTIIKPKPRSKINVGTRKRHYKKKINLNPGSLGEAFEESVLPEPGKSGGLEMNVNDPVDFVISRAYINEQADSSVTDSVNNEQVHAVSKGTSFDSILPSKPVVMTWRRGRRKLISGNIKTKSSALSKKRTSGMKTVERKLKDSLEILEKLDPNKNDELNSVVLVTSKVRSERKKLKKAKRNLLAGSNLVMDSDVPVDDKGTTPSDGAGVNKFEGPLEEDKKRNPEYHPKITSGDSKHDSFQKQSSRQKIDNLFESFGYNPPIPPAVATEEPNGKLLTGKVIETSSLPKSVKSGISSPLLSHKNVCYQKGQDKNKSSSTSFFDMSSGKIGDSYNSGKNCEESYMGNVDESKTSDLHSGEAHKEKIETCELNSEEIHSVMVDKTEIKVDDAAVNLTKDIPKPDSSALISEIGTVSLIAIDNAGSSLRDTSENREMNLKTSEEFKTTIDIPAGIEFSLIVKGNLLDENTKNLNILSEKSSAPNISPVEDKMTNANIYFIALDKSERCDLDTGEKGKADDGMFPENVHVTTNKEICLANVDKMETNVLKEGKYVTMLASKESDSAEQVQVENDKRKIEDNLRPKFEKVHSLSNVDVIEGSALSGPAFEMKTNSAEENVTAAKGEQSKISTTDAISEGSDQYEYLAMSSQSSLGSNALLSGESESIVSKDLQAIVADVLAATFTASRDTSVNLATTLPVENTRLKKRRKRKKKGTNFIRRKIHKRSTEFATPSISSESLINTGDLSNYKETLVNEISEDMPGGIKKQMLKRSKKRRRNAWQRGVLKKAASISRKIPKPNWHVSAHDVPKDTLPLSTFSSVVSSMADSFVLHAEKKETENVGASPAVQKSLKNVLKKLETNANLAQPVLDENAFRGRFLRNIQPKVLNKRLTIKRKNINSERGKEEKITSSADMIGELHTDTPSNTLPVKRKRGRPRKQTTDSFPKLTPLHMLPILRNATPWNKTPPNLSPHDLNVQKPSMFVNVDETKNANDPDFVSESVDDTDLHLYLSGVSDEDQSPKKDSSQLADVHVYAQVPVNQRHVNEHSIMAHDSNNDKSFASLETYKLVKPGTVIGETSRKIRPKMKGKKGCPPGTPMTEEEKKKKAKIKMSPKMLLYGGHNFSRVRKISQKITQIPGISTPSVGTSSGKFSLRQKFTRSPLEMLAMKRKQEEDKYDQEQEKRQARLIHLREKRSARESGDGFSDDGECVSNPLISCSVVLDDFVKKLQLDDIEPSSGEEVNNQSIDPEGAENNAFTDQDSEDWCADFQDNEDEEWNNNRPYIPRLKLKRVFKKGTLSEAKIIKPKTTIEKLQEPIKLVLKTEPVSEPHEQTVARSNLFLDLSKERSGFENSFMDFLKGKIGPSSKNVSPVNRTYNISKPAQPKGDTQNNVPDLSSVEIISLPTTGFKGTLLTFDNNFSASFVEPTVSKSSASLTSAVKTNVTSADILPKPEIAHTCKVLPSVEDEDDDILILDLEDGATDRNSVELLKSLCNPVPSSAKELISHSSETSCPRYKDALHKPLALKVAGEDNVTLTRTQRTLSNDEMGLMLESYKSQKDTSTLNQADGKPAGSLVSSEKCSENKETTLIDDFAPDVNCTLMEGESVEASSQQISLSEPCQSDQEIVCRDVSSQPDQVNVCSSERLISFGQKDSSEATDSCVITNSMNTTQDKTKDLETSIEGNTSPHCAQKNKEEGIDRVDKIVEQQTMDKSSVASKDDNLKKADSLLDSDLLTAVSDESMVERGSVITVLDNNNVPQKVSASVKIQSDDGKSPKHSTHYCSELDVLPHSDKTPSGKCSCKRCFTSPTKMTIESHIYSHIPGVQFRCAYCESELNSVAALSSHLKNTHALSEAKIHFSHMDERNFRDKETGVCPGETGQQSPVQATCASTTAGGQSPPVFISVVVSGNVGSSRGGRSSALARRFVCTHCGFSTNIKEDAEHHVLDLHSSQALFACLLCSESDCYTESEIKEHCATVHPARNHPHRKLPDFYDAEQLYLKEREVAEDDRENLFERMSTIFQDDTTTGSNNIDHRQKAKEYLYLQERLRAKTRVEADSTTAVDYTEEHNTEGQSASQTPSQVESTDETNRQLDVTENEVSNHLLPSSKTADVDTLITEPGTSNCDDAAITSSAANTSTVDTPVADYSAVIPSEISNQKISHDKETSKSSHIVDSEVQSAAATEDHSLEVCPPLPSHDIVENEDDDGEGMGLKIVQVVSLSGQSDADICDQIQGEYETHSDCVDIEAPLEGSTHDKAVPESAESTTSSDNALELSVKPRQLSAEEPSKHKESQLKSDVGKNNMPSENEVSCGPPTSSTSSASTASSSTASPSFAGGLPLSYKCNACKVHTPYLLMMVKHLKARHPNMHCFSCPYCKTTQSFVSQKQLRHHVKQSHPEKFGRNEIALSEDAKKFVEAMVLPMGPECIRVGHRIVLEEDIHTCTYCQVKMTSLANVYEHLNTKHSDLFEFVCPLCQKFKSKLLEEISNHCMKTHKSTLDTDKVHVSVPKSLFTVLTCISKNGKYIEKSIVASTEKAPTSSTSASSEQQSEKSAGAIPRNMQKGLGTAKESHVSVTESSPLRLTSTTPSTFRTTVSQQATQPFFAVPLVSAGIGITPPSATNRPVFAIASALFDTSSLTASPQLSATPQPISIIQNAAASSFLYPAVHPAFPNSQLHQPIKQLQLKSNEKSQGSAKNLPVLNVPTIKPRVSSASNKSIIGNRRSEDHITTDVISQSMLSTSSIASILTTTSPGQRSIWLAGSTSSIDNLPDDEPDPDAFKIFNLRPAVPVIPPSSISPNMSPVPSVFPPASNTLTSGYVQGPIAGFPPGMIISPTLLPLSFPYSHQPLVGGMLAQKQSPRGSPLLRHPRMSHQISPASSSPQPLSTVRTSMASQEAVTAKTFLQKQQQQELYLKRRQHQLEVHREQLIRQNQQQALPRAHPAHQQPPSLSGQVYQPQPLPLSSLPFDHKQPGPSDLSQISFSPSSSAPSLSSTGPPSTAHHTSTLLSSPGRPVKGVHKRSSSFYQCPYCPIVVTLKALEVPSHIQQYHPGKQVTFKQKLEH